MFSAVAALSLASDVIAFSPATRRFATKTSLRATGADRRASWGTSYAPFDHDGRVGTLGEIGSDGGPSRQVGTPISAYSTSSFVPHSSSGAGGHSPGSTPVSPAYTPTDYNAHKTAISGLSSYGIGSWNKLAGSSATGSTVGSANVAIAPITTSSATPAPTKLRRPIVAGNWKLNPATRGEAQTLLKLLAANFVNHRDDMSGGAPEAVIFPPLPYIADAVQILEGSGIAVGAQNVGANEKGAFTGEIAPSMLTSSGCSYVLLGHSERRTLFGENDEHINKCLHKCLEQSSLKIILCIGETLQEYENGQLEQVVDTQIRKGLEGVDANVLLSDRVIIAYEPVWAIGTGLVATPDQAQAAHVAIRNSLASFYGSGDVAASVRIQYGGSVTPESIEQLMGEMDIDGALVGGASLNADSFTRIFDGAASADSKKKASN